jgi:hypothetical protein
MSVLIEMYPQVTEVVVTGGVGPRGEPGPTGERLDLVEDTQLVADSGNTYTNSGATGAVVATLPASADVGDDAYRARFCLTVAATLRVQAQGADVIRHDGVAGSYVESDERDAHITLEYVGGGVYLVTSALAPWVLT